MQIKTEEIHSHFLVILVVLHGHRSFRPTELRLSRDRQIRKGNLILLDKLGEIVQ